MSGPYDGYSLIMGFMFGTVFWVPIAMEIGRRIGSSKRPDNAHQPSRAGASHV